MTNTRASQGADLPRIKPP